MKEKKLTIKINRSTVAVFEFCLNPKNTPLWADSIVKEEANEQPTKLGTIYRNVNRNGQWSEYAVVAYDKDKMFELKLNDNNYHVRYTLIPVGENECKLEYYEWVETDDLAVPFTKDILNKLKTVIENTKLI
ncbi:MAG: SRPBCC family protein [Patescibacteria group bacterium]